MIEAASEFVAAAMFTELKIFAQAAASVPMARNDGICAASGNAIAKSSTSVNRLLPRDGIPEAQPQIRIVWTSWITYIVCIDSSQPVRGEVDVGGQPRWMDLCTWPELDGVRPILSLHIPNIVAVGVDLKIVSAEGVKCAANAMLRIEQPVLIEAADIHSIASGFVKQPWRM